MERLHQPVMVNEVIESINLNNMTVALDCTFGEGGHSEALLKAGVAAVYGVDRDREAIDLYKRAGIFRTDPRLTLFHGRFSRVGELFPGRIWDAIVVDLGSSTRHFLDPERGFSFDRPGPLDMRMDRSGDKTLASRLKEISADTLMEYLENAGVIKAKTMARKILEHFRHNPSQTTAELANLAGPRRGKRHPATQLFLGLRMMVNEECNEIRLGLPRLVHSLTVGGRLAVLTFHSTEDRLVKNIFKELAGKCVCEQKICVCPRIASLVPVTKHAVSCSAEEAKRNPRARSAKLRCVEKSAIAGYNKDTGRITGPVIS